MKVRRFDWTKICKRRYLYKLYVNRKYPTILSAMATIILVEDDPILQSNFTDLLTDEGFAVEGYTDRQSAMQRFEEFLPDIVLLDISLGRETEAGFQLCQELRKKSETIPIIFLTSHDSDFDKISGMRLGADDYLTKDISMDYLLVRINALLRRIEVHKAIRENAEDTIITKDKLSINLDELVILWDSTPLDISLTQFWIVRALANHSGHVHTHSQLMEAANITVEPNTIAAHIKNIRERFEEIDPAFSCIKTERGIGYRWATK